MTQKTRSFLLFLVVAALVATLTFLYRLTSQPTIQLSLGSQPLSASSIDASLISSGTSTSVGSSDQITSPDGKGATSTASISLLFVGDLMLDRNVAARTKRSQDPSYPFRKLADGFLTSSDLTIGNLEGPITPVRRSPVKSIDFQFDPSWVAVLKEQGFDAFSQANNHALDQGNAGYSDSVTALREAGFTVFGHQVQDGFISLATTTVKGETIAFLGWNTTDNPIDRTEAALAIAEAKKQAALTIAYLHWGSEYRDRPDASSVELGHWLIDQGVDVVIGGHPHWAQGVSSYKGKPIIWSLGNFIFDQDFSVETKQSLAARFQITKDQIRIQLIPLAIPASQPELEKDEALTKRLKGVAKVSDAELQEDIENGKELVFARSR